MTTYFQTKDQALKYKKEKGIFGLEPEQSGDGRWILVFPIKAHLHVPDGIRKSSPKCAPPEN